jgi:hypothetical protein
MLELYVDFLGSCGQQQSGLFALAWRTDSRKFALFQTRNSYPLKVALENCTLQINNTT